MTASFIIYVAYGIEVKDMDDPIVVVAERAVAQSIGSATAGRYLVDFLPLCKYSTKCAYTLTYLRVCSEVCT